MSSDKVNMVCTTIAFWVLISLAGYKFGWEAAVAVWAAPWVIRACRNGSK